MIKTLKNNEGINEAGLDALKHIMDIGTQSFKETKNFGNIVDYKLPSGIGVRFNAETNKFIGFLGRNL